MAHRFLLAVSTALALASPAAGQSLTLERCRVDGISSAARCGTLEVWEDRAKKMGRRVGLKVVVLPAIAATPEPDPLFFLAGGPGQAATEIASQVAPLFKDIRTRRDLVFIDQRGTGSSNPLDCEIGDPDDFAANFEDQEFPEEELRACIAGYDADPRHYTTPIAMDDLDEVRSALGYERINLYGGSYGTRAALIYLRRHGTHVRSATLDGSAPVAIRLPLPTGEDGQRALDRLFTSCDADAACKAAFPALAQTWRTLIAELEATPRAVRFPHPRTAEPVSVTITADAFAGGVRAALYNGDLASLLPLAITRAAAGEFAPFGALVGMFSASTDISLGMFLSVVCAEDVPRISAAEREAALVGSALGRAGTRAILDACGVWPAGQLPDAYFEPVTSDVPVLLLSGALDPVTPPRWGEEAKKGLTRARHIVAPGTGHGVIARGCVPKLLAGFLDKPDPSAIDATCVEALHRPPAFVTPNGPVPVVAKP